MISTETIAAIATGQGGALSVIRVSGINAINIVNTIFYSRSKKSLSSSKGFTIHYGDIRTSLNEHIDDVIVSLFRNPNSYTGEDLVEISSHGSRYIEQQILSLLLSSGCRIAQAGEFTLRAYCNGKMDLVQAEAVADLISSDSESSHRLAVNQMRGGYSKEFSLLRADLLHIMSMLELELDFGEEDVEFADRTELLKLLTILKSKIESLTSSFSKGNAIKKGVPVAIVGRPNAGKSTLLNALLKDDRAIVSSIAGTTRDIIEETINIGGVIFRFIDTAGIRHTDDMLENMGIERTFGAISKAQLILLVADSKDTDEMIKDQLSMIKLESWQSLYLIVNKCDCNNFDRLVEVGLKNTFNISAKNGLGISKLEESISNEYSEKINSESVVISNLRHYDLLMNSLDGINMAINGLESGISTDFITQDLRQTVHYLGSLTGEISTDDILGSIFTNFCIGK